MRNVLQASRGQRLGAGIDRALSVLFPGWARRRMESRARFLQGQTMMTALTGYHRGARRDRPHENWLTRQTSADAAILDDLAILRDRSRDLIANNAIAAAIHRAIVDNVVGTGMRPQARIDAEALGITPEVAELVAASAEAAWERAVPWLDVGMRTDAYGLQRIAAQAVLSDGESFGVPMMVAEPNRPIETAIDVIEADRVDTPPGQTGENLRNGIVLGKRRQPVAYWIADRHPGDAMLMSSPQTKEIRWRKVRTFDDFGRRNVIHVYRVERPGQTRGRPLLAPVMDEIVEFGRYSEAERVAARAAACITYIVRAADPWVTGNAAADETDADGKRIEELVPGTIPYLAPGQDITAFNPQRPGNTFEPYIYVALRQIGAGIGLPLELVLLDFSKTNYSSARAAILEARRFFGQLQRLIVDRFCQPVWDAVLEEAWLTGRLPGVADFYGARDLWTRADWIAPGWGWVDPVKEIQASRDAVDGNLSTLAEECAGQGRDWQSVMRQRARELKFARQLGIPEPADAAPAPAAVTVTDAGEGDERDA